MLPFSEACERNKDPILRILRDAFAATSTVLEIGSGTGQHAVYFSRQLRHLVWQPTELTQHLPDLEARVRVESQPNLRMPIALDVTEDPWPIAAVDGIFSANTLHIMPWSGVEHFFRGVGQVLPRGGVLCIYGPFRYSGGYTSESNAAFDRFLKQRDPLSGIRDTEGVDELAGKQGLRLIADHPMPANNQTRVWRRDPSE